MSARGDRLGRLRGLLVRRRVAFGFLGAAVFLWAARPEPASVVRGLILSLPGLLIRSWAAGHVTKTRTLTTSGPYGLVRNPLYLGSFVIGAGVVVMGRLWIPGAAALVLFGFLYRSKILEEERHLAARFGPQYEAYRRTVPRVVPRRARPVAGDGFSWRLLARHREWRVWLGLAAVAGFLWWRTITSS